MTDSEFGISTVAKQADEAPRTPAAEGEARGWAAPAMSASEGPSTAAGSPRSASEPGQEDFFQGADFMLRCFK
jgi:hypothetical protein